MRLEKRAGKHIFLSTPSARRATVMRINNSVRVKISIHALREEGDSGWSTYMEKSGISIHALREEGDRPGSGRQWSWCRFLSTPSARRATINDWPQEQAGEISIHALREEGDPGVENAVVTLTEFLSTPSARRATSPLAHGAQPDPTISIHALREEGDGCAWLPVSGSPTISIHALREEGDFFLYRLFAQICISIHALREEGDWSYG